MRIPYLLVRFSVKAVDGPIASTNPFSFLSFPFFGYIVPVGFSSVAAYDVYWDVLEWQDAIY